MSFGVFPPPLTLLEHLYELGYQDMETWLQNHLEERLGGLNSNEAWMARDLFPQSVQWNWVSQQKTRNNIFINNFLELTVHAALTNLPTGVETFWHKMLDETSMIASFIAMRDLLKVRLPGLNPKKQ